jgi:outer membrane protein assembly factor BamB
MVRAAVRDDHGVIFAYTDAALYALDEHTFAPRWHIDGEVWTVLARDLPLGHDVLTIERTATPRVVLRSLDAAGEELRRVTVYEGNVAQAHLERSRERIRSDLWRGVLIVHVAE